MYIFYMPVHILLLFSFRERVNQMLKSKSPPLLYRLLRNMPNISTKVYFHPYILAVFYVNIPPAT